ncbi:hypothetical protein [Sphingobium yanoikuyae]|jgi:hypothetical protein|uniref:Phage tail assembly protein n=1 Tax=Sphingobium yanoikuyae TaxID=13690 RepID=A0A177JZB8_SPHYA|nr:hypothetical protein [Sphingobium yanoikuyae]OAH46532.1 hypothetical protein AX777_01300 [Sphingobium yanoikuyae]
MDRISAAGFRTEVEFTLPKGYIDETGLLHKRGVMRLATAADEILPLRDPRVQSNPAYLTVIILARVITRLGNMPHVDTGLIEGLFACDIEYLRQLYEDINSAEEPDGVPVAAAAASSNGRTVGGMPVLGEA